MAITTKRLTLEYVKRFIEDRHPGGKVLSEQYINGRTKIDCVCERGHIFNIAFHNIKSKDQWCVECRGLKKITLTAVKTLIEAKHPGSRVISEEYVRSGDKLNITCEKGHNFWISYNCLQQGKWCAVCAGKKKHTAKEIKDLIGTKHPGCKVLSDNYTNNRTKLHIVCEHGHEFSANYNDISQNYWCPDCGGSKKLTLEFIKNYTESKHLGCKVISEEYKNSKTKLNIVCEHGHDFSMIFSHIQNGVWCPQCAPARFKQTCNIRYGCDHPLQNREMFLKSTRTANTTVIKYHWKTGEEVPCRGGYEQKTVDFWNSNKVNYVWQPRSFLMSTGRHYHPDAFLPDQNIWIEIKGRWHVLDLEKWTEFHEKIHPNSELWNREKLKEIGIL